MYKDFFELTPPGTEVIHLALFKLFGLRNWIPNFVAIVAGLTSCGAVVSISRRLIPTSRTLPLLPAVLYCGFFFTGEIHRWYSSAALLAAVAVLMEGRQPRRLAFAGLLCGLASFFTQTQGFFAAAGLVTFLLWQQWQRKTNPRRLLGEIACVVIPFLLTLAATYAYFIEKAGLGKVYECLIRFPALYRPLDRESYGLNAYVTELPKIIPLNGLPQQALSLLIHCLLPLIYVVFLIAYRRWNFKTEEGVRLMLLNILGLFMFASVAPAATYFRLFTVSAPALIVLIYWLRGRRRFQQITIGALWIFGSYILVHRPLQIQLAGLRVLDLPRGPIAFSNQEAVDYEMLGWLSSQTKAGDNFFAAAEPGIYFPLALRPMDYASVGYDNTGETLPENVQNAIATLNERRVRLIQWPPMSCDAKFYRPEEDNLGPLRRYVAMNYHRLAGFDGGDGAESEENPGSQ